MEIAKSLNLETYDIVMKGKFTFNDHPEFREILQHIAEPNIKQIVLHMSQVDFIDSAALGMLLLANDEAEKYRKRLVISGAVGQVKKMFDMARFNMLFYMEDAV